MRPLFLSFRAEKPVSPISRGNRSAEGNVSNQAVNVDGHPGVIVDSIPNAEQRSTLVDAFGRIHKGEPGVGYKHNGSTDQV